MSLVRTLLVPIAALALFAGQASHAQPDVSGEVDFVEPNFNSFTATKRFEVYFPGNPTNPYPAPPGEFTYIYVIANDASSERRIIGFDVETPAGAITLLDFIDEPLDVDPSSFAFGPGPSGQTAEWEFLVDRISPGEKSDPLVLISPLAPGTVNDNMVSLDGEFSLDAPGTCIGPSERVPACEIEVDKTCCIPPPPRTAGPFVCSDAKPIDALSMEWAGTQDICVIAYDGEAGKTTQLSEQDGIMPGDVVTVSGMSGSPNDQQWEIYAAGDCGGNRLGVSEFHISCSDSAMNGPEDCGMPQGNGKSNESGLLNDWLLEGISGDQTLECTPPDPDPDGTQCVPFGGSTGNDCRGKVLEAVFEYTGATSCQLTNAQEGKAKCEGSAGGASTVTIVPEKASFKVDPSLVGVDQTFSVTDKDAGKELKSSFKVEVIGSGTQKLTIHTSCSKPLNVGDEFGSLKLVELTTTEGGTVKLDTDPVLFKDACELPAAPPGPHCTTKVASLVLRYLGGDCSASQNGQDKPDERCTGGDPGALPISVVVTKDADKVTASVDGDLVTFTPQDSKLASDTEFRVTGTGGSPQSLKIHTSCSKPLNLGDRFGAFEVFAIDREDEGRVSLGGTVEYQYKLTSPLTNTGTLAVTSVFDSELGELLDGGGALALEPGEMVTLFRTRTLLETTTNVVDVDAQGPGASVCTASDEVTVELVPPPGPPFVCSDAKPIRSLTMIWDGPDGVNVVAEGGERFDDVQNGDVITFSTNGDTDLVLSGAVSGISEFHVSCSDEDMNGPEDCGKLEGDAKGKSDRVNLWRLAGITGESATLTCPDPNSSTAGTSSGGLRAAACGFGFELALLLPGLMWWRGRRRA